MNFCRTKLTSDFNPKIILSINFEFIKIALHLALESYYYVGEL